MQSQMWTESHTCFIRLHLYALATYSHNRRVWVLFFSHLEDSRRRQDNAVENKRSLDAQMLAVRDRMLAEEHQDALEVQRMMEHWAKLQVHQQK